ncbi:MAG: hypothetical protein K7J46_00995 [Bryobacter sp.]|nr:hypothetical protein [Bryobacter sp. CoA8 C33]
MSDLADIQFEIEGEEGLRGNDDAGFLKTGETGALDDELVGDGIDTWKTNSPWSLDRMERETLVASSWMVILATATAAGSFTLPRRPP